MSESAIERDKEIAAKATVGKWFVRDRLTDEEASKAGGVPPEIIVALVEDEGTEHEEYATSSLFDMENDHDLEWIVRMRLRFPAYLALVDALRAFNDLNGANVCATALSALDQEPR